ncbi:hypothetical protein D083_0002 [Dickeya solani RNS 08.23.3.1.A]|nr:hypothetical protein D083_0002 [Dickeya solani RNS 08.23.3.1.A]
MHQYQSAILAKICRYGGIEKPEITPASVYKLDSHWRYVI